MLTESTTVMPLVSVIIPNYNNANYLVAAIDSVLQQDYPNLEVIVIDDGSIDNSIELLANYKDKIILLQQKNQGAAAARNTGLRQAKGEFIAFHDSDDLWLPEKLKVQVNFLLINPDYIACYTQWAVWDGLKPLPNFPRSSREFPELQENRSGWLYIPLLNESVITTISIMIRTNIVRKVGFFNETYLVGEDHDYWLRLSQLGQIAKLSEVFAIYRVNLKSTTKKAYDINYSLVVLEENVKKYGLSDQLGQSLSEKCYRHYVSVRHFTYGYQCFWAGKKENARKSFYYCIKNKKFVYKSIRYIFITFIPCLYKKIIKQ